jgi:hypothetical protein
VHFSHEQAKAFYQLLSNAVAELGRLIGRLLIM